MVFGIDTATRYFGNLKFFKIGELTVPKTANFSLTGILRM